MNPIYFTVLFENPSLENAHLDRPPGESSGHFEYVPLRSDNDIRLVKLLPAKSHEPITCSLIHAPLGSADHPYEALSYTWGSAEDQALIKVNGEPFSITHNLHTALRYLRKERGDNETTLWIDAISINQDDEKEKTVQVALMTKIYQSADQVIVWLGPAGDNSNLIMEFFKRAAEEMATATENLSGKKKKKWQQIKRHTISGQLMSDLMDESQSRLRRALEALLEREYWYRAWVVQEILVAREIVLVCGTHSVGWDSATAVVEAFVRERSKRIRGINKTQQILDEMALEKRMREEARNEGLPSRRRRPLHVSAQTVQMSHHSLKTLGNLALFRLSPQYERGPRWLLHMLVALRDFKSKDRRDKIFGLLGLINRELFQSQLSSTTPLEVDYSLDFRMVSTRLFQYYLSAPSEFCRVGKSDSEPICWDLLDAGKPKPSHQGAFNILCASQPTKANGFPSWLADFSRDNGMEPWPILDEQYPDFQCNGPRFSSDQSVIYVPGVTVTDIKSGYVSGKDDDPLSTDELGLMCRLKASMDLAARLDPSIITSPSFWNALLLKGEEGSEILSYLSAYFRQEEPRPKPPELLLKALEDGLADQEDYVLAFFDAFRRRAFRRRFAIFHMRDKLYPAMVPAASEPGDTLCLLWGCECPVLLRKKRDKQDAFEFIGPCSIPGWYVWNRPENNGPMKIIELH